MKKKFVSPQLEIIRFPEGDIILASDKCTCPYNEYGEENAISLDAIDDDDDISPTPTPWTL